MSKKSSPPKFLDQEEEELFRATESDKYVFGESALTPARKMELQIAARNAQFSFKMTNRLEDLELNAIADARQGQAIIKVQVDEL